MRAISLWQPWASAIVLGLKKFETRGWSTNYRGPLIIHAAKRWNREQAEFARVERNMGRLPAALPLGALIAVVNLDAVFQSEEARLIIGAIERLYGDYSPGRYAWHLTNILPLAQPIPWAGRQGFFEVPDEIVWRAVA